MFIYRHILKEALVTAWTRKELWFFGLFAAILNTGSVLDTLVRTFHHSVSVESVQDAWLSAVPGLPTFIEYFQTFALLSEERRLLMTALLLIGGSVLVLLSVNGQANLFHHLKQKTRKTMWWHSAPLVLGRLLVLNLIARVLLMSLGGFAGSILASLSTADLATNTLVTFATLVFFVPIGLLIGAISLLAMVEITLKKKTLTTSIMDAFEILRHHGVAVIETSILLFLASLLGTLVLIGLLLLLALPYVLLVLASLTTGSLLLWTILTILGGASAVTLILLFGGFLTSFVYTTWYLVYQKLALRSVAVSKLERLLCVQRSPLH